MKYSRNPVTGIMEAYTDDGVFVGNIITFGDVVMSGKKANDGGPGSGNFNHEGRPGLVGGSGPGGESPAQIKERLNTTAEDRKTALDRIKDQRQFSFFARYMNGVMYGQSGHEACYAYSFQGDVRMNNLLRGGKPRDYEQQAQWKHNIKKTKGWIDSLTETCANNKLARPAIVFRGIETYQGFAGMLGLGDMSNDELKKLVGDKDFAESLIGQTFSDPAFVSSTIDYESLEKSRFIGPCEMEIFCPVGTEGAYFGDQTRFTDEHEFLLQRGTQFVITDAEVVDENPGRSPKYYHLKLKVDIVDQAPKDIPESYTELFAEPRDALVAYINTKRKMRDYQLNKFFPGADPSFLSELNKIRGKDKRDADDTHRIWELISLQHNLGMIDDVEAAELESYAMNVDRTSTMDSYRRSRKELEENIASIESGDYESESDLKKRVLKQYPNADKSVIPLLMVYMDDADRTRESLEHDIKLYGDEGIIVQRKKDLIEENLRGMEYIAKHKRIAR